MRRRREKAALLELEIGPAGGRVKCSTGEKAAEMASAADRINPPDGESGKA